MEEAVVGRFERTEAGIGRGLDLIAILVFVEMRRFLGVGAVGFAARSSSAVAYQAIQQHCRGHWADRIRRRSFGRPKVGSRRRCLFDPPLKGAVIVDCRTGLAIVGRVLLKVLSAVIVDLRVAVGQKVGV